MTAHPALASAWDLTALLNAADATASRPLRHLWLVRLIEWLRHGSIEAEPGNTPRPVLRIRHLLNVLERNEEPRHRIVALLASFWQHTDLAALLADFGFSARRDLWSELRERLALRLLPATPDTDDGATLFGLLFTRDDDADWLAAIDAATLARLAALFRQAQAQQAPHDHLAWRTPVLQAMTWLASAVRAAAFAPELRRRMSPALLTTRPFDQLARAQDALADALQAGPREAAAPQATFLRALLQSCREAADSVHAHLASHGVSVDIMFELEQLQARSLRLESLLDLVLSNEPQRELQQLLVTLVGVSRQRRSLRGLLQRQYALMARKVAERHAETGEHYITRNGAEYRQMLGRAAGGGAIIGGTTLLKFGLLALSLAPFWSGLAAGLNYAISFVVVQLLHWTVATKQPAMTAPALADKLAALRGGPQDGDVIEAFVDEIVCLVRSQMAGIVGNVALVVPVVLAAQGLAWWLAGAPLVSAHDAHHVLDSISLLGLTALFAAFTGVLLFASSLVAGWAENGFVFRRLDSALAHHPGIVARLGAARAQRWADWWLANISGLAANVSLGLMLGLLPVMLSFVGLHIEVRHVTLSSGQLAAAVSTLGWATLGTAAFWWCAAGLVVTGALNLGVSFWLALRLAMRARNITPIDQQRLNAALRQRLRQHPRSFVLPD